MKEFNFIFKSRGNLRKRDTKSLPKFHLYLLSPPFGGSLLGCPCVYKEFFLDWMGFDREAKDIF